MAQRQVSSASTAKIGAIGAAVEPATAPLAGATDDAGAEALDDCKQADDAVVSDCAASRCNLRSFPDPRFYASCSPS